MEDGLGEHYTWSVERGSGHYPGSNDDRAEPDRERLLRFRIRRTLPGLMSLHTYSQKGRSGLVLR